MKTVKLVVMALALLAASSFAVADEITVSGSTVGTFSATGTNTLAGLTVSGGSFSGTTVGNFLSIGGASNNLGTLSLSGTPFAYTGSSTLDLAITFTLPTGIIGSSTETATANLYGTVASNGNGGVTVYNFSPVSFSFSNGSQAGDFTLYVNNVSVIAGGTAQQISGYIFSSATSTTPEPASLVLLGSGLLAGAGIMRRKLSL